MQNSSDRPTKMTRARAKRNKLNPFEVGRKYRVLKTYTELNHTLREGEIVVFVTDGYDPHSGVTRFWFRKDGSDEQNVWHVWDNDTERLELWTRLFEPLT